MTRYRSYGAFRSLLDCVVMSESLRISSEPSATREDKEKVREMLGLYNVGKTGFDVYHELAIFLRDAHERIRGGVLGDVWGGWLHVHILWVEGQFRSTGKGLELMQSIEAEGRELGATYALVDSHSFQAPDFYKKKLGYEEFGVLEDAPIGHRQHFMWKRL
jgi:GNAT superfamily N-acetyltransferase